jgi:hypothetical protein
VTRLHDLFSYVETAGDGNESFGRYEADHRGKWAQWGEGRNLGAWDMPLDVEERKSLAYHLYRCVLAANHPGAEITHWMYHHSFDENIYEFQRDFLEWLVAAMNDVYESSLAGDTLADSQHDKESSPVPKDVFVVHERLPLILTPIS